MTYRNREIVELKAAFSLVYRAEEALYNKDLKEAKLSLENAISSIDELVAREHERVQQELIKKIVTDVKEKNIVLEKLVLR